MPRTTFCLLVLLALLAARASAEDTWSLMTADLKTEPVVLKSIDAAGLHVATSGASGVGPDRVVLMDQFVEVARSLPPVPLAGRFALHLAGGDKIGGEPVALKGEQLVWKSAAVGETEIPMRLLAGVSKPDGSIPDTQRKEDVIKLANGDAVQGTVADFGPDKVTIQTSAGNTDIPLGSLVSIAFATTAPGGRDKPGYRVRLDDGSSLLASAVGCDGTTLQITLQGGKAGAAVGAPKSIELSRVAGIEQVNGPVSWLSSRTPGQSVYYPLYGSSQNFPARMNASVDGSPIRFKDRVYIRGIGVHSYSKLVYPLDGKTYTAFRTRYAISPNQLDGDARADVTIRMKLDDKVAYEREHVRGGELSPPVVLDLNGATNLTLEVDYGANGDAQDHLNWIEPAVLKVKPAPEPEEPAPAAATTQPTTESTSPTTNLAPVPTSTPAPAAPSRGPRP